MSEPAPIPPDVKDWTWVLSRPCPACGFDAARHDPRSTGEAIRATIPRWQAVLARPDAAVRARPDEWSPLEYGCHVRDVCEIFTGRLGAMIGSDGAEFSNWDQDAAALEKRYWAADPARTSAEYAAEATSLATAFDAVPDDRWQHRGVRSNGAQFTVETLSAYLMHDFVHHLHDCA